MKGSCPWVFAWDGTRMRLRHRLPVAVAARPAHQRAGHGRRRRRRRTGCGSRGDQLVPRDGAYDVRITAELWETHFFDHVSLLVVDHPADTEVFVDERFSPARRRRWPCTRCARCAPVARAWDERGARRHRLVTRRDGRYLASFARGAYQGIAQEHFVEFELGARSGSSRTLMLVAQRLDLSDRQQHQRGDRAGRHVHAERAGARGAGRGRRAGVIVDAGSRVSRPARTRRCSIDLARVPAGATRLRLRTNLEVYWDALARRPSAAERRCRRQRLPPSSAELRVPRLLADDVAARRCAGDADLRAARQHDAALARSGRLLHALRRRARAAGRRRRSLRDHERRRRAAAAVRGAAAAAGAAGARFRADRRRLGEGRRLQHRLLADGAAAAVARPARLRRRRRRASRSRTIRSISGIARTGSSTTRGS